MQKEINKVYFPISNRDMLEYSIETMDRSPCVDRIVLVSPSGKPMHREPDLIDVWFDSGAMPFAQWHYPFEHHEEIIRVRDGSDETLDVQWSRWGPVVDRDHRDRQREDRHGEAPAPAGIDLETECLDPTTADGDQSGHGTPWCFRVSLNLRPRLQLF